MAWIHWIRYGGIGLASLGIVCMALGWFVTAAPPAEGDRNEAAEGKVAKFVENDHGDMDGFLLDSGKLVHFPPHMGDAVAKAIKIGDRVKVSGRDRTLPRGEQVLAAEIIQRGSETIKIEPPQGPGPGRQHEDPPMEASGLVKEFSVNSHDDVDGFVLDNGTVVKFPPHQGKQLSELVAAGTQVEVTGRRHETPDGDVHLHADLIKVAESGKSLERDRPGPPPHGPGPHDGGPEAADLARHDEIMRELREIRRLLEERATTE